MRTKGKIENRTRCGKVGKKPGDSRKQSKKCRIEKVERERDFEGNRPAHRKG